MAELMFRDPERFCPDCGHRGDLDFVEVPKSQRTYSTDEGDFHDYFGPSRDYECRNCGAAFTLTDWEDVPSPDGAPT